jgi:hypothetical protein
LLRFDGTVGKHRPDVQQEGTVKGTAPSTGERSFVLVPRPRRVGPGRIERDYQRRIDELEQGTSAGRERLRAAELDLARARGELDTAARVAGSSA